MQVARKKYMSQFIITFTLASVRVAGLPQWVNHQLSPFAQQLFSLDIDDISRFV
jgi:hypothetical protein